MFKSWTINRPESDPLWLAVLSNFRHWREWNSPSLNHSS